VALCSKEERESSRRYKTMKTAASFRFKQVLKTGKAGEGAVFEQKREGMEMLGGEEEEAEPEVRLDDFNP